ncbi:MAG: SgcJ/EcaC family oxidoreductase [Geminicoccaceae bacterium]|nr:SgcJ/EcaC family oxidoreductase [Geminicoccaceae bacterium]
MAKGSGPEAVASAFVDAWNRHDMRAFGALFAEDADFVNVVGTWWKGQAEIEAAHARSHATVFRDSRLDGRAVSVRRLGPGAAAVHLAWGLTGHLALDGGPSGGPRRGILLLVVTEEAEGWRIRAGQNTDVVPGLSTPPVAKG